VRANANEAPLRSIGVSLDALADEVAAAADEEGEVLAPAGAEGGHG